MRAVLLGMATLGIVWLATWITGPAPGTAGRPLDASPDASDFARRIGGAQQRPDAAPSITVSPQLAAQTRASMPVRHDSATARAVWGAAAEFAPTEP